LVKVGPLPGLHGLFVRQSVQAGDQGFPPIGGVELYAGLYAQRSGPFILFRCSLLAVALFPVGLRQKLHGFSSDEAEGPMLIMKWGYSEPCQFRTSSAPG
jgi:hypothetical protein